MSICPANRRQVRFTGPLLSVQNADLPWKRSSRELLNPADIHFGEREIIARD
jgi:hypothetical protein